MMEAIVQNESTRSVLIDFLFIDLETCTRCKGTDVNLESALQTVQSVLASAGTQVIVRKTLIDTESKALEFGFVASPTLRVDGWDIALELRESSCASCGDACGCDGKIHCRVWIYEGQEHTVAPVPMIVNAILASVYGSRQEIQTSASKQPVPENLKRFFDAKKMKAAPVRSLCCGAEEQATCCEPAQKSACCAPPLEATQPATCGCR